jgi:hypothetical protein
MGRKISERNKKRQEAMIPYKRKHLSADVSAPLRMDPEMGSTTTSPSN